MFKCKECGTEYDIKPDFCDCGNDTFEEIASLAKKPPVTEKQPVYKEEPKSSKPDFHPTQRNTDVVSPLVFLFCITLAVIILFFVGNPKQEDKLTSQKTPETQKQIINLPSIDSLWNNSTAGIINNEKSKKQQAPAPAATQVLPAPVKTVVQTPVSQPVKQQPQAPVVQNPITQKIKQTVTNTQPKQPVQNTTKTPQTVTPKPNIPKTTQAIANGQTSVTAKTKTTQQTQNVTPKTTTSNQQTSTPKTVQTQTVTPKTTTAQNTQTTTANIPASTTIRPKTTVDTQAIKKEYDNYKIGLRNTIGRKIDFANVIGDGDCTVSFKIASNGKLTNRAFTKQSANVTLNDAVYSAVMSTPSYNPPPTGYNNETLNLHIKFYNGNFDISLN